MFLSILKRCNLICLFFFSCTLSFAADIEIGFCPVTKIQSGKQWNATLTITNNTNEVLNFKDGTLIFKWQNLESLPYPFTSWSKSGEYASFSVEGVGNWKSELAVGATWSKQFAGATFSGVLAFPTSGTFTYNGKDYSIAVDHCSKTEPYELYDATFDFDRACFIKSPTSNMCLGEGASEIWQGEGVFDVMMPQDRPSWAIGTMVAHRLFTNLAGVEMLSPNFWTATALNESRMTCDPTIVPDQINHWKINSGANTGTGIDTRTDNCFQVLNIGYTQIENNQPDLFGQTNAYGTASYSTVIAGGRYETGALAVTGYHYQDIRYWNQIFCWNAKKFHKEAQDPYAIEKVFYHAFHDGPNAGIALLNDIDANYAAAIAATDMNTVISTGGTWSNLGGGSSRKVANFTSLLDGGNGHLYNSQYVDGTQEYYGCYEEPIKWTDILYYLDKIKILYPQVMDAPVEGAIKAVFDGLAGGGDVMFSNLGPVIDEIVIQMGGHDPSGYLATQYASSKVCNESPLGVSLRNNDTLCPGEEGLLEVWLAGDKNYAVDIKFPDGSIKSYTNIDKSPFNITIDQPGDYEVVYFEDADEVGDVDCNFASLTVESKNGSVLGWDKSSVDIATGCASGDLILTKVGTENVIISYTKDGLAQTDIVMGPNETTKNIISGVSSGTYIITNISPNSCGTPVTDTITFCGSCIKPQISILTPDTTICDGDTAFVRFNLTGTADYDLYFKLDGIPASVTGINTDFVVVPVNFGVTLTLDSLVDANCTNDTITNSVTIALSTIPVVNLGGDASICSTSPNVIFDAGNTGATYLWSSGETTQTISKGNGDDGDYSVIVTNNGCVGKDTVNLTVSTELLVDLGVDLDICTGTTTLLDAGFGAGFTFDWNENGPTNNQTFITGDGQVTIVVTDAGGCTGKDTIVITEANPLKISLGKDTSICIGDPDVVFSMVSGRTDVTVLEWNDASTGFTLSGNATQDYWLAVDSAGCIARDTVALVVNALPKVDLGTDTFICSGTNPTIILDPGLFVSYQWADITNSNWLGTTQTENVSTVGSYGVVVVDLNGCVNGDTIVITQENATVYNLGNDTTICPGGNTTVSIPNAIQSNGTWQWLNDNSTTNNYVVSNQVDGNIVNVILEYKNEFGCLSNDTLKVTVNNSLLIEDLKDTAICEGEDVVFISGYPVAGYTFSWQDGSTNNNFSLTGVTAGDAGMVKVDIVSSEGCSGSEIVNLVVNLNPVPGLVNGSICTGQKTILDHGLLNVTSIWTPTNETTQTIEVANAGTYSVVVTDVNNCIGTSSAVLTVNNPPVINLGNDQVLCEGEKFNLNTGFDDINYTNLWSGASTATVGAIEVTIDGDYEVIVTDILTGCSGQDTVNFIFNKVPDVNLGNDTAICEGENLEIYSNETNPSYTYLWSTNDGGQSINVSTAGNYVLTVTNGTCSDSDDIALQINPLPNSKLSNDTILCFEDLPNGLVLDPGRVGVDFIWNTTETSQAINVNEPGVYIVDITSMDDCFVEDMITIKQDCPAAVWLPNAITSDGNNLNDNWVIQGRGVSDVEVLVFNRWGELIWTGNGIGDFWDGTYKGKPVMQDVYVYKLTYSYLNVNESLKTKSRVGQFAVIR